jgi:large subunit ribosomal protein L21
LVPGREADRDFRGSTLAADGSKAAAILRLPKVSFPLVKAPLLWNFARLFPRNALSFMAYAIIRTGGRQYRVAEGDTVDVDLLDVEPGKTATLADVLMYADGDKVTHGSPIEGAKITAEVVEHRKDKKVIAFKYRRRKGYHRTVGHRRKLTRLKIKSIAVGGKKTAAKKSEE